MGASETFTFNIKAVANMEDVVTNVKNIQNALNQLKLSPNLKESFKGTFKNLEKELEKYQNLLSGGIKTKGQASALEKSGNNIIKLYDQVIKKINLINDADLKKAFEGIRTTEIEKMKQELTELQNQLKTTISTKNLIDTTGAQESLKKIRAELSKTKTDANKKMAQGISSMLSNGLVTFTKNLSLGNLDAAEQALGRLEQKVKDLGNSDVGGVIGKLREQFNQLKQDSDIKTITENLQNLKSSLSGSEANALQNLINQFKNGSKEAQNLAKAIEQVIQEENKLGKDEASTNTEIESFKSRMQYMLGLTNSFYLLRRAIKSAINTVKELDKAMTETAVVTDMTVSDMWNKLPEYTKRANQLGVSTLEAYQAATLYYQQGLDDTQVEQLSTETLRMARIAGLEAADATDRMTNALRGFNMELDATNAQKVDDVYSKLAAMSASNVDEISTAMTKVASLAHNANMDFETTAAFLAQIIETTRESAETAGTALKTVIARFSEVKKLVTEDQIKGTDEEGQAIDVNKVSTALRSVGIDLNKYFLGEVGLDDIFMELASKWDSLTSVQQRYIATQAAGSRQQSRFIAMMQDYARTQELVSAAYNANGASAEQFEKTQDSLQSKLARLKNAWDEFLMGITNSSFIKFFVDALTKILNIINDLTTAFGALKGNAGNFISGLLKLFAGGAIIRILRQFFNGKLFTKVLGGVDKLLGGKGLTKKAVDETQEETAGTSFWAKIKQAAEEFLFKVRQAGELEKQNAIERSEIEKQASVEKATTEVKGEELGAKVEVQGEAEGAAVDKGSGWYAPLKSATPAAGSAGAAAAKTAGSTASSTAAVSSTAASGGLIALGVIALIAEIWGTIKLIQLYNQRYKRRLEKAEKISKDIANQSKRVQEAQVQGQEALENYTEYSEKVDNAKTISSRNEAIKDRNEYITSLLEQNAAYARYIHTTFENGEIILTLDSDALAEAVDKIADTAVRAKGYSAGTEAVTSLIRAQVYEDEIADYGAGNWIGSAIGGTLLSVMGPIGPLLGYLLGSVANSREVDYEKTREDFQEGREGDIEWRNYQLALARMRQAQEQSQAYIQQAAANLLTPGQLSDEASEIVARYFGQYFDSQEIQDRADEIRNDAQIWDRRTTEELRSDYYRYYGIEPEEDVDRGDLVREVAYAQAIEEIIGTSVSELEEILSGENGEQFTQILASSIGEGLENIDLSNIDLDANNLDLNEIFGEGFSDQVSALEEIMDLDANVLRDHIIDQLRLNKEIQRATKRYIYANNIRAGFRITYDQYDWIENLAPEQASQLESITSKAGDLGLNSDAYQRLFESLQNGTQEYWNEVETFLENIDLSKPINSYLQLQEAINNVNDANHDLAQSILEANLNLFNPGALVQDFINSGAYDNLTDSLSDFINENNEISSSNILELAKSSEQLNNLLKTGVITSKALAIALTGIEKGTIAVTDLNSHIISALNAMDDLDGVAQRVIEDLNNFNPGYDENEIANFISQVYEFSQEQLEKGAIGNNQMQQYMEYIFGQFEYTPEMGDYGNAYQNWLEGHLQWLEANQENMYSAWYNLLGGSAERAFSEGVRVWEENGEIFIDTAGHTTDDLIQILTEGTDLTEQQIRMMVTDFKNYSPNLRNALASADTRRAVLAWYEGLGETAREERIVIDNELQTLATLLGTTTENILDILRNGNKQFKQVNWDETLTNAQNAQRILQESGYNFDYRETGGTAYDTSGQPVEIARGTINFNTLRSDLEAAGLSQYFEEVLNDMVGEGENFVATINGQLQTIRVNTGETASEAYQRTIEELGRQDLAERIAAAQGDQRVNINFNADTQSAIGRIQSLKAFAEQLERTYILTFDGDISPLISRLHFSIPQSQGYTWEQPIITTTLPTITNSEGGIIGSYASGASSHKLRPGISLTGEEAPEIVWNREERYAYITGIHGPQFQNLRPGDQVFNGDDTRKILNNSFTQKRLFGSYAKPIDPTIDEPARAYGNTKKGSGSGSGSSTNNKNSDDWKNDLDWLYDLMEDIAEEERRQSLLQEEYDLSLKDLNKTGKDLYDLTRQELSSLMTQLDAQQFAYEKRLQQMNELQAEVNEKGYQEYIQWNPNDQTLEIDWDKIEDLTDKDTYEAVKDLLSKMEKVQDQMDDAEKSIWDIKKQIQEIQTRYLEKYLDFQQKVLDAVVKNYQDNIDELNSLNDTIKEANDSILDSIQKEIDLQRQIRDNAKTESDIYDMEARLAYLLRDTSGANQKEIQDLQKQLKESRENYADTLIDQSIKRLQDSNSDAADQREQQIKLLEAQLEYWQETGALWLEVAQLIADGFTSQGSIIEGSALWEFLKRADSWDGLSEAQKKNWANELILEANEVGAHLIQLSGGMDIDTDKVINSIADINGVLTEDISVKLEQVRAILAEIGTLGGTPEHSNHEGYGYSTGGLNTHPGMAMLHGTSTEPEYVLNARQTEAFLRLADVLPTAMSEDNGTNSFGNNIYVEFNMNVGEIGSDYDVDRIVERVEEDIYAASTYRNVNVVSFQR